MRDRSNGGGRGSAAPRGLDHLEDRLLRLLLTSLRNELVIRHGTGLVSLLLYGSRARGTARPDSDIDLLLVAERPRHRDGLAGVREAFEACTDHAAWTAERGAPMLGLLPLTPDETLQTRYHYLDMVDEAVIVHDRDDFMRRRLGVLHDRMRELGSHRAFLADGSYLWILKPGFRLGDTVEF
jgi:predicted nucleotidyltransferase